MGLARKGTGKRGMEEKSLLEQNKSKVRGKDIQNKEEAVSMSRGSGERLRCSARKAFRNQVGEFEWTFS